MKTFIKLLTITATAFALLGTAQADPSSKGTPGVGIAQRARSSEREVKTAAPAGSQKNSAAGAKNVRSTMGGPSGKRM